MNHPVIAQPVPYDLFQITAPVNRQNRAPGDPCHTLAKDNAAHAAVAFQQNQLGEVRCNTVAGTVNTNSNASGRNTPMVSIGGTAETLQHQGYDAFHASTQETNAVATLRTLRSQIGEEAFAAWGLGILDSLQPQEVLRSRLHGLGVRCATFSRSWPIDCAISREEDRAAWAMQSVREAKGEGCPSLVWQLPQQLATELGAYLSELPRPGAQTERFVRDLWLAGERIGFLREALSAFQETRRPAHREGQSALHTMQVRRLTATECEFLQGFPRNWTMIPYRGKSPENCPDGPRYKALGNSMACNCMAWIGERIAAYEAQNGST
jgi:DNA (cytosine-5)-methyltransferase 1